MTALAFITREERNLLIRVTQHLRDQIQAEEAATAPTIAARARRNRLLRDQRDLVALRQRLEAGQLPLQEASGG